MGPKVLGEDFVDSTEIRFLVAAMDIIVRSLRDCGDAGRASGC